jgi:hypothetical protein
MLGIYAAAMAIPAWRMFYLAGMWSSIFALSIIVILGLDTLVAVACFHIYAGFKKPSPHTDRVAVPRHRVRRYADLRGA